MGILHELLSYLVHLIALHMVNVTDSQSCYLGNMSGLLATAIEEHRHRKGWHHGVLHLLVGFITCNGLGQIPIQCRFVLDITVVLQIPQNFLESYGTTLVGLQVFEDTNFNVG